MADEPTPEQVNAADEAAATAWMVARNLMLRYAPGWIVKIAAFSTVVWLLLGIQQPAPITPPQPPVINVNVPPADKPAIALPPINDLPTLKRMFHRGYVPLTPEKRAHYQAVSNAKHGGRLAMLARNQELPPAFDCRAKGWVLPVGDQADCGSCYLYSTVYGTASQAFVKAGYGKPDGSFVLSVQFGMDCHNFGGCNGGNGTEVIDWMCSHGWPAEKWIDADGKAHADYPAYDARSRSCRQVAGAKPWKPASWGYVASNQDSPATTLEIKTALYNYGPLNVSLDAGGQFGNGTGTITNLGRNVDHEIELVAYDDNKDGGVFLLKNQWTTQWGNGGYRWVTYQAARNLVDVFFVTATPLPPPPTPPGPPPVPPGPVPPVPPGPTPPPPINGPSISLSGKEFGAAAGTYHAIPKGSVIINEGAAQSLANALAEAAKLLLPAPPAKKGCDKCDCATTGKCTCDKCDCGLPKPAPPMPPTPPEQPIGLPAEMVLYVPDGAIVTVNGMATTSTGSVRRFLSPPIQQTSQYTVTVTSGRWTEVRNVIVRPGVRVEVSVPFFQQSLVSPSIATPVCLT